MRISVPFPRARDRSGTKRSGLLRRRWLLIPLILLVVGAIVFWRWQSSATPSTATTTATVSQGTLTIAVSGSGTVAAARTVEVPFQQAGTVTAVDVKVGDQVTAGQTLATIDAGDLELQLQQAQANLKAAQATLEQAKAGNTTPQNLASAQASVESARAQLEQTRTGSATAADIQSAQAQLAAAQAQLDALKNPSPATRSAAQIQLSQAQTNLLTTRDSLSQAKSSAYTQMQQAANSLTQAQSKYATALHNWEWVRDYGTDPANPISVNGQGQEVDNTVNDAQRQQYYDAFVQAEAALRSAEQNVQQAQVNYDTTRQNEAAQIPLAEQQVANAQAQYDALLHPTANDLAQAQAQVTQAQASLTKLRQGGTVAEIAQAQAQVAQAEANLETLTAPASESDLAAAEANVIQAQVAVDTAQRNLDQATLRAPFDGIVAAVSVQPGGLAGTSTAAVTIVDRAKLHIEVSLSEADAAKVQIGQPVALTFDALPDVMLQGTVATVAPVATVSQNVVTYPVQVEFEPGDMPVKVGMSATADIEVQQIADAVLVPSRAVQTVGDRKIVTLLQGAERTPSRVRVETGVTSDGQTVITSCVETGAQCLKTGDVLLVTRAATNSQNTNQGGFEAFPGTGGPPGRP